MEGGVGVGCRGGVGVRCRGGIGSMSGAAAVGWKHVFGASGVFIFLLAFLCAREGGVAAATRAEGMSDRVHVNDVKTLTLISDAWTNSRRTPPVKQLRCVGGTAGTNGFAFFVTDCFARL